ncbi:MAG: hypothetical protein CBB71_20155 [Rhodopirellula sp. TMED11]|nr:MAG: hypothetical protein CBB71_20155 [Rhodopirellula sp. TMED11]
MHLGENTMKRNVISGIAAFALLIGAALCVNGTSADAGSCGGNLLSKLHQRKACCGPTLLTRLKAKMASCCEAEPCCEEAPACEPAPAPSCCEPEPCCGSSRPKLFARLRACIEARRSCCAPEPSCCAPVEAAPEAAPAEAASASDEA